MRYRVEKKIEDQGRPQMTIWRMCIACWIPKAKNTTSEYVILLLPHCNNCCTNAPRSYVIRTLPALLVVKLLTCTPSNCPLYRIKSRREGIWWGGGRGIAPLTPNLGTDGGWAASCSGRSTSKEMHLVPIDQGAEGRPGPFSTYCRM